MSKTLLTLLFSIFIVQGAEDHEMGGGAAAVYGQEGGEGEWVMSPTFDDDFPYLQALPGLMGVANVDQGSHQVFEDVEPTGVVGLHHSHVPINPADEHAGASDMPVIGEAVVPVPPLHGGAGIIGPAAPPVHAGAMVGLFVPPAPLMDPWDLVANHMRANAHLNAFPFAPRRAFLCNIQKSWLNYWKEFLGRHWDEVRTKNPGFTLVHRNYPLLYTVPSFGWRELERRASERTDEHCQMCGRENIREVIIVNNMRAPRGYRNLRVGITCAVFMVYSENTVWQTAFDNEDPLP